MSKTPAVLVCDARTGSLEIAGLTVLDRLVVTAHRAGCGPIFLTGETAPALPRAGALGIQVTHAPNVAAPQREPALLIEGSVLVEVRDLENVIAQGGQLVSAEGVLLPVRMTVEHPKPVVAGPAAMLIVDASSAAEAERRLWTSLTSTADGLVDRFFNRPLGRPLSKLLVRTPISPNQVSILSILIGVASAWFFARGNFVAGALVFQLCAIVDCVDGDLARALFKQSRLGKWLDLGGDQVVHFSVFAAIGIGVARVDPSVPALALGASAALGVLLCFALIVRALRQPAALRGPLLNKLLDATANRDFSILLLALAIFGRMDLFLWMAGIGIHVFWIALLALHGGRATSAMSREAA
ncbi:MAG TPA: CDP-alcohol phosphatidyltransferase family protein [Chthoniobacterales bacterium]|nr:CDP-alcohol phosphatidyltransferase family protein [Chthoniobacterales bacterium]